MPQTVRNQCRSHNTLPPRWYYFPSKAVAGRDAGPRRAMLRTRLGDSRTHKAKDCPQLKTCRHAFRALKIIEPLAGGALSDSDTALLVSEL